MKVKASPYLKEIKPVLRALVEALSKEYAYASVLATDNSARRYQAAASGLQVGENALHTSRGFVARVADARGYAEHSFNTITMADIPAILAHIRAELVRAGEGLAGILATPPRIPHEEETVFSAATEYECHPEEVGAEQILRRLSAIRESALTADPHIVNCSVTCGYQEIH